MIACNGNERKGGLYPQYTDSKGLKEAAPYFRTLFCPLS